MDHADALLLAVAAAVDLAVLFTLVLLRRYRARRTAAFRMAAGLRLAFRTGRLAPVQFPVELPLE